MVRLVVPSLALLLWASVSVVSAVDERSLLLEFYEATGGASWTNNNGWAENASDLCDWHGVLCRGDDRLPRDIEQRRKLEEEDEHVVIGLSLEDNFLAGRMPDSLWSLPNLEYLDVSYNTQLTLSFVALDQAKRVETIKMHFTDTTTLSGIGAAAETLQSFHVSGASLSSAIPPELMELTSLRFLHMSNCNLQGTIPYAIGQLSDLRELNVAENELTGTLPDNLETLSHLRILAVARNKLSGSIPESLATLGKLHEVFLEHNNFFGPLPAFDTHPELYRLKVESNDLTGAIPEQFLSATTTATKDVEVNLSRNRLTGVVPASLDVLAPLTLNLNLANNQFTDVATELCDNSNWNAGAVDQAKEACWGIACPVGTFSKTGHGTGSHDCVVCETAEYVGATQCFGSDDYTLLQSLYVATGGDTSWRETKGWMKDKDFCEWFGVECNGDKQVVHLHLANNGLQGTIPETLFHLMGLQELDVSRNDVVLPWTGISSSRLIRRIHVSSTLTTDFDGIENAPSTLRYLFADHLPIDGPLPNEILALSSLRVLSMAGCGLNGELSPGIVGLASLRELYLYDNELRGSIPPSLGALVDLTKVSLAQNQLVGIVPSELQDLARLEALSLMDQVTKGGGLTGLLPSFSTSSRLIMLMLGNNRIGGSIPSDLLALVDGRTTVMVNLSNNRITGTVPGELKRFEQLNIYLQGNEITEIDPELCFLGNWMGGLVSEYRCDAILCPANTMGGRQVFRNKACQSCPDDDGSEESSSSSSWFGKDQCGEKNVVLSEREILELLYNDCGGEGWSNRKNWLSDESICSWYGVTCDESNEVKDITLENNQVTGAIPTELYLLPKLEKLSLYSNEISVFFEGIENAENLETLTLDSTTLNSLQGIGMARSLKQLSVSSNQLAGPIPVELKGLVKLESLSISDNSFTGEIPFWISEFPLLSKLLAANNNLDGPLYDFADMDSLVYLDLTGNQLRGDIPPTLLRSVSPNEKIVVDLSSNNLSGTVPIELKRLTRLSIQLANNQITAIGEGLCEQREWNNFDVDAYGCDGLICPIGYSNAAGRQTSDRHPCVPCGDAKYMGSTICHTTESSAIQPTLLITMAMLVSATLFGLV